MTGPTKESIEREFPGWRVYWSFGMPWARLRDDEDVRVRGEDLTDLRDEIKRRQAQLDEAAHAGQ